MAKIVGYEVTNKHTGKTTRYTSGVRASRACDRMDNAYGAIICTRRAIWDDSAAPNTGAIDSNIPADAHAAA